MTLVRNWREVLRHAWSLRLIALAGLLSGAEYAIPAFIDAWPRGYFLWASMFVSIAAAVARFVAQRKVSG